MNDVEMIELEIQEAKEVLLELEYKLVKIKELRATGCQCDPDDWRDSTPNQICEQFVEGDYSGSCDNCEHPEECH